MSSPEPFFLSQDLTLSASLMMELPVYQAMDLLDLNLHPWIVARPRLFRLSLQALAQKKGGKLEEKVLEEVDGDDMLFFVAQALHHYRARLGS